MQRRTFLTSAAAASATLLATRATGASGNAPTASGLIDTNVYLSDWVIRHSWADTPAKLVAKLRRHGVTSAWVGSFEGVLHTDIAGVNARLAGACLRDSGGILRPFGTINPALPDWEDDVRRCHEVHRMPGVRLFPNYHGYTLDDPRFARLLELCGRRKLLVQIALSIEDERSQNPALAAAPVNAAPLADILPKFPRARVMLLNASSRILGTNTALLRRLTPAGVLFEIAILEMVAGIEMLLKSVPEARIAFGSHVPYFYFEAALLKLQESALTPAQMDAVRSRHAQAAITFT